MQSIRRDSDDDNNDNDDDDDSSDNDDDNDDDNDRWIGCPLLAGNLDQLHIAMRHEWKGTRGYDF